ncbi:MAG: hypothetical protein JSW73_03870 [Candidatus Woesearchaeota archaeon]|nr:MAG: hypothetical protein JSW73_03870 [Candidatus Woesearchaeota archaeon]
MADKQNEDIVKVMAHKQCNKLIILPNHVYVKKGNSIKNKDIYYCKTCSRYIHLDDHNEIYLTNISLAKYISKQKKDKVKDTSSKPKTIEDKLNL